jgi:hypothetical protein
MTGRGVLVTLTPRERKLIHDAVDVLITDYRTTAAERATAEDMLRRIPAPEPGELT